MTARTPVVWAIALLVGPYQLLAQSPWDKAEKEIQRLEPGALADLPPVVRSALDQLGCTIPQAWGNDAPHNVIQGSFAAPEQRDWAALCSSGGASSILVFWGGSESCASPIAPPSPDRNFLQVVGVDGIAYSRGISAVRLDPSYWVFPDSLRAESLTHDAISDAFFEKGATAYYCRQGTWVRLTTND